MTAQVVPMRRLSRKSAAWSDDAVALACASADPEAVAELFDRFHVAVTRYLSRVLHARADIEDLVQATFLEIARGRARFGGRSTVRTWVLGIATNVVRHHLRSLARRRNLLQALGLVGTRQTTALPSDHLEAQRGLQRVQTALARLPDSQRLAFVLCELEGLSAREAAQVLDSNETAIWKRVSVARRALLSELEGDD